MAWVLLCSPVSSMAGSGLHADCKQYCTQQWRMLRHFWGCLMRTFDSCLYTRAASRRRWVSGCAEAAGLADDAAEADATSPNPLRALLKKLGRGLGAVPALMECRRVPESCCSEPWRSIDPALSHKSCAAQVVSGAPLLCHAITGHVTPRNMSLIPILKEHSFRALHLENSQGELQE